MISCKLSGGLGNQLFQIFTTISYALNNNKPFVFLNNYQLGTGANGSTIRYTYWDHFLSALKPFLKNMNEIPQFSVVREEGFGYSELSLTNSNIVLVGHFQSPLYFYKHKEMICRLIRLGEKQEALKKKINMMDLELGLCLDNAVSIHFRLGDYKNYPDKHPILSVLYYINAIQFMVQSNVVTEDTLFLYFCEEDDLDEVTLTMTEIQKTFPQFRFQRATNGPKIGLDDGPKISDWEEMMFMSLCSHNIIANSTFSWWSAYLNNHPNKIVCCPETWFGPQMDCSMADFFPEDWKRISCLKEKNERQPTNQSTNQPTNQLTNK